MALLKRKARSFGDLSEAHQLRKIRKMLIEEAMNKDILQNREFYEAWPARFSTVAIPVMIAPVALPVFLMAPEWIGVSALPSALAIALSAQGSRLAFMYRILRGKVASPRSTEAPADLGELRAEQLEMGEDR